MLRLNPDTPPHVVAFTIDGTVTAPDLDDLYRSIEKAMSGKGPIHLCGEIHGIGGLTLEALGANVKRGFALLPRIGRVNRYAVVTDKNWISTMADLEGAVIPGLEVRTFRSAERDEALAWASEPPA